MPLERSVQRAAQSVQATADTARTMLEQIKASALWTLLTLPIAPKSDDPKVKQP